MAGRKAMPVNLLLIKGKKHLTKEEIELRQEREKKLQPSTNRTNPPAWLCDTAKKEFRRIAKELKEIDLLTNVDVNALALYCDAYADYIEITRIIKNDGFMVEHTNKSGVTNEVAHPLLAKKKQMHEQMRSLAVEFGLTPASRAKIAMPPRGQPDEEDEFTRTFGDV
ncbi:phage terminase small subunit P27 family [Paenibacillus sp. S-38]|uniref:phage terminase small subunit P27 family n=1 Tax=Paenibacillus sp. S-38 TaxID=3416710 RepID=UPI003CF15520